MMVVTLYSAKGRGVWVEETVTIEEYWRRCQESMRQHLDSKTGLSTYMTWLGGSLWQKDQVTPQQYLDRCHEALLDHLIWGEVQSRAQQAKDLRARHRARPRTDYQQLLWKITEQERFLYLKEQAHRWWSQEKTASLRAEMESLMERIACRKERPRPELIFSWLSDHEYIESMFDLYSKQRFRLLL
jgi:hypothetical protein